MEQSTDIQVLPEQQFLAGVDPSTERQANLAQAIQSLGVRGVPLFGSFADPRAASRFAGQITGGLETLGEFLPGISTQLAQERDDAVGIVFSERPRKPITGTFGDSKVAKPKRGRMPKDK